VTVFFFDKHVKNA